MKIGIMGTRGIPNAYGGFEQFAENFSRRMVQRGHFVSVYSSSLHPFREKSWNNVEIIHCKDPEDKAGTFGQFIYDLNCLRDARRRSYDILLMLGYTSSSVWMWMRPEQSVTITNMDGLEWQRQKYSAPVRFFLQKAEKWAATASDHLIADSRAIQHYLKEKYGRESFYAAYGADLFTKPDPSVPNNFGVTENAYSMLIARPEPENNIETICEGYKNAGLEEPLLIVGNFENRFGKYLKQRYKAPVFRFCGPLYEIEMLNNLRHFSRLYFHGHSVGGTNPSLLEAMASSALICAHDNVFNRSVLGDNAFFFTDAEGIRNILQNLPDKRNHLPFIESNRLKIQNEYSWETICRELEGFFEQCLEKTV